jgi:ABC-2 type transport system ATP-binding protein
MGSVIEPVPPGRGGAARINRSVDQKITLGGFGLQPASRCARAAPVGLCRHDPTLEKTPAQTTTDVVVSVDHLRVRYGDTLAVDDVSLSINRGEIFGILGPNGAGKTTTVEAIGGLRRPDGGAISVLGLDALHNRAELRQRVGIQLQASELPDKLRVGEALELFAAFYADPADPDRLLNLLGLDAKRDDRFSNLSGGQRQRLSIALALIGRPELAILDELTTGLDPQSRRETWKLIEGIRDEGVTVILVTHFMEEAERLCDRLALLHHGRVIAIDTPAALAAGSAGRQRISFRPSGVVDVARMRELPDVRDVVRHGDRFTVEGTGDLVAAVMEALVRDGVVPLQTRIEQSTLDDAFVALTADADAVASELTEPNREESR